MKHYFIVIDTNVLVSGLISRNQTSPPVGILKYFLAERGVIVPLYNDEIIKEYENTRLKRYVHPCVHCSIIYVIKIWKQPECPSTEE